MDTVHRIEIRIEEGSDAWKSIKAEAKRFNISTNMVCQIHCIEYFESLYQGRIIPSSPITHTQPIEVKNIQSVEKASEEEVNEEGLDALRRALDMG